MKANMFKIIQFIKYFKKNERIKNVSIIYKYLNNLYKYFWL